MCGLAGFWRVGVNSCSESDLCALVARMANALHLRGPDDTGTWADTESGVALGHQRLAIVDLSAAGHQPMTSRSGRYVMVFNGEIYNHLALRRELKRLDLCRGEDEVEGAAGMDSRASLGVSGQEWRGHSDTETLLEAFERWGVQGTLQRCVGMFAIALWDSYAQTLMLARDRLGEKPLYYGWVGSGDARAFIFGSELKALRAYTGFSNRVSRQALAEYMRFMYVPAPLSIYEGIYKLEPGCLLTLDASQRQMATGGEKGRQSIQRWWDLADVVQAGQKDPIADDAQAVHLLEQCLGEAVATQRVADVPLGAFLSGGVDSSTIVALMQQQARIEGREAVETFTIGFDEQSFDESLHALAVAKHLGTRHHEMRVNAFMARDVIPQLPSMYDEPFADSSQIPTFLVCKAARQHVTVALSGDAGDELFCGYNRYLWGPQIWNRLAWLPYPARQVLGSAISVVPQTGWDAVSRIAGVTHLGEKAHKLARSMVDVRNMDDLYWSLVTEWRDPAAVVVGIEHGEREKDTVGKFDMNLPTGLGLVERMMYQDSVTYLPDDILCKVDRAAMSTSLETRVPFLDYRVVELAWRMPQHMKLRDNVGKWALRQVLYKHVPRELIDRPKTGFGIPLGQWLRGPLRPWAETLLDDSRLRNEGYFYAAPIRKKWKEHLIGKRDHTNSLWTILMFQSWLANNKN